MTVETLAIADQSPQPHVNGGKSMKFTFQPESKPLDGYTIKRAIHRGGFGEVYYALTDAGKEVALKLLKQHFDVELRGVSQCLNLKHPNLVTIFDIKRDADGDHWVIMEYVAGKSLSQVLDNYPDGMPIDDVQKWLAGMTEGLSFLHDRGIVHRDLKPGNVFLENGVVKIGDVGLSKFISESHRSAQTQSVGTVYYMAPEVAHGRYGREVDVYSLGIVVYELLTGRVPFIGESAGEILMKHLSEKPDLSPLPRRLRPVLASALEKDPLRRTPTVRQLLDDFNKARVSLDIPQEIPEDSFLKATIADSSTVEREQPVSPTPASPQSPQPNFKDIFAGDVAKAMAVAERAARKAKEMADEAYRASWRHRRHAERIERKVERWNRSARRYREMYPTFWGWKAARKNCQDRVADTIAQGIAAASVNERWKQRRSRSWVKPVLIALLILTFFRVSFGGMRTHSIHRGVASIAILAAVVYLASRLGGWSDSEASRSAGAAAGPPAGAPPFPPKAGPGETPQRPTAAPAYGGPRRYVALTPDTPRLIPARQRMSELSLSLTYAAICTTLITSGLAFATNLFVNESQIAHFGGTLLVASWLVLAQAKMWEGRTDDVGARRISQIVIGAGIGVISYCLGHLLVVDVPTADSITPAVHSIGAQSLVESGTNGQPSLPGYIVFFAALMGLRRWWRQVDSFRVSRLAIWPIVPSAVVALALTAIFAFPTVWGMIAAMAISVTVQLSAAWVPPRERAALVEGAIHA